MTFKDLSLKRSSIINSIESFAVDAKLSVDEKTTLTKYTVNIPKAKEALLNAYFNKDGSTTLYAGVGKNHPLSIQICEHIIKLCQVPKVENKVLSIRKMTDEEYNSLLEFLTDNELEIKDEKDLISGKQSKVTSADGGILYLNKWESGTFSVQGNGDVLKAIVIEGLTNLLPYKDVIDAQMDSLEVEISADEVLDDLKKVLPVSYDFLGNSLHAVISPALVLKKSDLKLLDYACFTFPILRGLEGYIKKLFLSKGIIINDTFSDHIENGEVKPKSVKIINNAFIVTAIEECYDYYKNNRHILFHVDGTIIGTTIIDEVNAADSIINHTFTLIESTYTKIKNGK